MLEIDEKLQPITEVRVWLKKGAEKRVRCSPEIIKTAQGEKYIIIYHPMMMKRIPRGCVERVTSFVRTTYYIYPFSDGKYCHRGAVLCITTKTALVRGHIMSTEKWQEVTGEAPSLKRLEVAFRLMAVGKLTPITSR